MKTANIHSKFGNSPSQNIIFSNIEQLKAGVQKYLIDKKNNPELNPLQYYE